MEGHTLTDALGVKPYFCIDCGEDLDETEVHTHLAAEWRGAVGHLLGSVTDPALRGRPGGPNPFLMLARQAYGRTLAPISAHRPPGVVGRVAALAEPPEAGPYLIHLRNGGTIATRGTP